MKEIKKVDTGHPDLLRLIAGLDNGLLATYGDGMQNYNPLNTLTAISVALVLYEDAEPVACGCYKRIDQETIEVKRMFVLPARRGLGYSKLILSNLETAALNDGFTRAILETGNLQYAAIRLYESMGYQRIPNYGPYTNLPASVCYAKTLNANNETSAQ